jgi:hypothetical protein
MRIDVTPFRLDVEQQRVDLYVENTLARCGNLIVEAFDLLAQCGIEICRCECLTIDYDEWHRG